MAPFYAFVEGRRESSGKLRVRFAGQLPKEIQQQLTLTVASPTTGVYRDYYERVARQVAELGLADIVTFLGKVAHCEIAQIYKSYDLLVFLSTREDGLLLVMVEAMIAGCAVETAGSGGTIEIAQLADLPLVPRGDSLVLAQMLAMYVADPKKVEGVALRGQRIALSERSLERMMDRWQDRLQTLQLTRG